MLETVWFVMVAGLFTGWLVFDGFDFGVGLLSRFVARTEEERRQVLASILPVWDGNEVWLLAAGGSTLLAFPRFTAAAFSGFYLPVIFLVWALIVRGVSIELRNHLAGALWKAFFDTTFWLSSSVVPLLIGVAVGNLIRGAPLNADGFFAVSLFASDEVAVLDVFTVTCGVASALALSAHGAAWLVLKTDGAVAARAERSVRVLWISALVAVVVALVHATPFVDLGRPVVLLFGASALAGVGVILSRRASALVAFLASCAVIVCGLAALGAAVFPTLLRSTDVSANALTITNSSSTSGSMSSALWWWWPGILLVGGYYWWVLRHFRGKAMSGS